jgi:N-acetylglucosaminyl-diphospho-decaprenol L-rhamnosyltransferase
MIDLSAMHPKLDIIIVNWNSGDQLQWCLDSILTANKDNLTLARVVVVDNASRDRSADELEDFILPLYLISNTKNLGFAAACNQGAKGSKADYLLFLNPDARLFKNSLTDTLKFIEQKENNKIGILGIQLVDDNGKISHTCAHFPSAGNFFYRALGLDHLFPDHFSSHFMTEWDHRESRDVNQVMGSFFLVRRSLFQRLGGFDERFFVYFEDLDLSYRAWKAGWRSVYFANAQAYHKGSGTSQQIKDKRLFYNLRSRILYSYKHFGWRAATIVAFMTTFVEPITRFSWAAMRLSSAEMIATLKGYSMLWRTLPAILVEARRRRKNEDTPTESL